MFIAKFTICQCLTSLQNATEKLHQCAQKFGEPVSLEPNVTFFLERFIELNALRERLAVAAVDKFDFVEESAKLLLSRKYSINSF